jgi:Cytochrome oxidase c assembly
MYRKPRASVFADFLHKGFVVTCVGVTVYGLYLIGMRAERYFSVIRPQQKLRELEQQKSLLAEGRVSAEELRP